MKAAGEETRFLEENGFLELRMLYGNMNGSRRRSLRRSRTRTTTRTISKDRR